MAGSLSCEPSPPTARRAPSPRIRFECAIQTLTCGDASKLLARCGFPVHIARPDPSPVGPDFVAVVVPLHGVAPSSPHPDTKLAACPPSRLPERLDVSLGVEIDDAEPLAPQVGHEAVQSRIGEVDDLHVGRSSPRFTSHGAGRDAASAKSVAGCTEPSQESVIPL